jgi:PIN domain nuclease of toxin-antitoxin system
VNFLIDTHVWIWTQENPERIGPKTKRAIADSKNALYVSAISTMEIARLVSVGRLKLSGPLTTWVSDTVQSLMCGTIEISHEIAASAYALPGNFHRDPADRLLIATARIHELILLTADERILRYPHVRSFDVRK